MPDDASIGGGRSIPITSSKGALISISQTINFIDNWLQRFEYNNDERTMIYKEKTSELLKNIPKLIPIK